MAERVVRIEIPCEYCGKVMLKTPRDIKKHSKYKYWYCSQDCASKGYRQKSNEFYEQHYKYVSCLCCNKIMRIPKWSEKVCCSKKCSGLIKRNRKELVCSNCNKAIERTPALTNNTNFCSKECQNEFHRYRMKGKNNPRWEGGITNEEYPFEWNSKVRKQIKERDNYTCCKCGLKKKGNNIKLDVHHINKDKNNCNKDNLITLCHTCHMKYHAQTQGKIYLKYTTNEWKTDFNNWLNKSYAKVLSVTENKEKEKVYNLEVKDNNNYLVNNHLVHNCIIDESAELTEEVWTKIARMLLKNPNSKIVELYNPWFLNHTFEHSQDPEWNSIKIDWHTCLAEGRFTQEQIDMVMQEIRNPIDQRVLLDAEFPDTSDKSLFKYSDILFAQRDIQEPKEEPEIRLGIDVARLGRDDTICYLIYRYGGLFVVKNMWKLDKQRLTKSAGDIIKIIEDNNVKVVQIDSTGIGAGLDDMLSEYANSKNIDVVSIVFSEKPNDIHNANRKADIYFNLAELFSKKCLVIPTDNVLVRQLRNMQFEVMSNGKKKIVDNQEKSPDCFIAGTKVLTSKGYKNIEEIDYNDKIITPYGTRDVMHKVEKETNELVHITFTNGKELYTTPNHKIFSNNTFIKASNLNINNRITTDAIGELLKWRIQNLLNIKGRSIGFRRTKDTTMQTSMTEQVEKAGKRKHCTDKYMKTLLEKEYQKDGSYTILMEIFTITIQRIWNLLQKQTITSYIWLKNLKIKSLLKGIKKFWTKSDQKQKSGIVQKTGESGTESNTLPLLKMQDYTIKPVCSAGKSIKLLEKKSQCSVVKNAVGHIETITLEKPVKVYNITVSKDNVYYANSILVSNCADALAIGCYVVETNNKMWIDGKWV
jgi:intein/homing endonuclease